MLQNEVNLMLWREMMQYINREILLNDLTNRLQDLMMEYDLEDIGIYEEQGAGDEHYIGFTIRKNGAVYMVNLPFVKNQNGELVVREQDWTIQKEDGEAHGYRSLDEAIIAIDQGSI
jgi:hypothetical protein